MGNIRRLLDVCQFPGFCPKAKIKGIFGDPKARVIRLERRQKNRVRVLRYGAPELPRQQDTAHPGFVLWGCAGLPGSGGPSGFVPTVWEGEAGAAGLAGQQNPLYTKRFAWFVGRRCRAMSIRDVAKDVHLDWHSVKGLEKQYMAEQLRRTGIPAPKVIGIDEIVLKK